jgi:glycosyltransferase domain-containing protein
MSPRLTIVMPLRGRNLFTLRFLYYADRMRMPYRFLVADGLVHPRLAEVLENSRQYFPNLDIEYIRYPDDKDFAHFFNKMADVLGRVTTSYVMIGDNDDFIMPAGLEKAVEFLNGNSDFVGYSGRILSFSTYSGLADPTQGLRGRLNRLFMCYKLRDAGQTAVLERFRDSMSGLWPYYAVMRTEALATVCREIAELSFSDLQVHEAFHVLRVLTMGRVRMDGASATLNRQFGTSLNASFKKDWVHHLVRSRLTQDIEALVSRIGDAAVAAGADPATIREDLYAILEGKFRQMVKATYGSMQELKHVIRRRMPRLLQSYKNRPRAGVEGQEKALAQAMARDGASSGYLAQFHQEIAAQRAALSGRDFADFVRPFEPVFATDDASHRKPSNLA